MSITDKDAFTRVMGLMGMAIVSAKTVEDGDLIIYEDKDIDSDKFTTRGYEEFYAGAIFDKNGAIVKGYIDSHVAHESDNAKLLGKMWGNP